MDEDPTRLPSEDPTLPEKEDLSTLGSWTQEQQRRAQSTLPEGFQIGNRYEIRRFLGQGGMGAVYRAYDNELDREIALKLIRPDLAENPSILQRFKREIQLASEVTHRNVLRVYDLGESEGVKFLTMQFIEGEDLSERMKRKGALDTEEIIDIFTQTCAGLAAAHEQGVTHRDLKPQNIMIDQEGRVYLTDFGLAKSLQLSSMTETGSVMGTPHYMSPEQVKGEKVDSRSDVYSLGIILYEMATGQVPFQGSSAYEVMVQRLQKKPLPITRSKPGFPAHLQNVVSGCLEVNPSQRYASAAEVLEALESPGALSWIPPRYRRWLVRAPIAALLLIFLIGGAWWIYEADFWESMWTSSAPAEARHAVGVLPFSNRTGNADMDWYGEGIARLVADALSQSRHVRVAAVDRLKMQAEGDAQPVELADAAGLTHLVTGEIYQAGQGLSLSFRVITEEGEAIAGDQIVDLGPNELMQASRQISVTVRRGLNIPLEERIDFFAADFATENPEAYQAYVEGMRALSQYDYKEAEHHLKRALEVAPDYAMARYRLAYVLAATGRTEAALREIKQASAQTGNLTERENLYVKAAEAYFSRDYDRAIDHYEELLQKHPYEMEAHQLLSDIYLQTAQAQKVLEQAKLIQELDPTNPISWSLMGHAYMNLKDYSQAIIHLKRYAELAPQVANSHHVLGDAYRSQGELDLAAAEYKKALEADSEFYFSVVNLAEANALRGNTETAITALRDLAENESAFPRHRIDAALLLAHLYRAGGRFSEAAQVLETHSQLIEEEQVRYAMALSIRGLSQMELGRYSRARDLIDQSLTHSPGVPTRYLFARGLLEHTLQKPDQVLQTAAEIAEHSLPPDNPDRTEEKAAAYLRGLAGLSKQDWRTAVEEFSRSISLSGYPYRIYRLGLARAYLSSDQLAEALAAARQSHESIDYADPRLDLQEDRVRALLLLAEIYQAMGRAQDARSHAQQFLDHWAQADPGLEEMQRARRMAE